MKKIQAQWLSSCLMSTVELLKYKMIRKYSQMTNNQILNSLGLILLLSLHSRLNSNNKTKSKIKKKRLTEHGTQTDLLFKNQKRTNSLKNEINYLY